MRKESPVKHPVLGSLYPSHVFGKMGPDNRPPFLDERKTHRNKPDVVGIDRSRRKNQCGSESLIESRGEKELPKKA